MSAASVAEVIERSPLANASGIVLVGVRGYYLDSMGERGRNDRGIYDDALALCVLGPSGLEDYATYNFNVDPSVYRSRIAVLQPGLYWYKRGIHGLSKPPSRRYEALVQAREVLLDRDGPGGVERGYFGINIHRGGRNGTSSLGCQTVPPDQWPEFIGRVFSHIARLGQREVPYLLIEEGWRRGIDADRLARLQRAAGAAGPVPARPPLPIPTEGRVTWLSGS